MTKAFGVEIHTHVLVDPDLDPATAERMLRVLDGRRRRETRIGVACLLRMRKSAGFMRDWELFVRVACTENGLRATSWPIPPTKGTS